MADTTYTVQVIRSRRKTVGIEIRSGTLVLVRAPMRTPVSELRRIVDEKRAWIEKSLAEAARRDKAAGEVPRLAPEELDALANQALIWFPPRVRAWAERIGVRYGRITIRSQQTRWGSCSSKGNLNFNCLLMLTPPEVIDSVVVHELCHRKEMNHSKAFYAEVLRVFPDYWKWDKWLKENGPQLMRRMLT